MDEQDIRLENGELLSVKVNFLTLYLIKKTGIDKLQKKLKTAKKEAIDAGEIEKLFIEFKNKMEKLKKKEDMKM